MKNPFLLALIILIPPIPLYSQVVIPEKQELEYPETFYGDTTYQRLKIFNPWPVDLMLDILVPNRRGDNVFLSSDDASIKVEIKSGDTLELEIPFIPIQNTRTTNTLYIRSGIPLGTIEIKLSAKGKFKDPYYQPTDNLYGEELIWAFRKILAQNQDTFSYNKGRDLIFMEVDNLKNYPGAGDSNALVCIYTHRRIWGFANRKEAQGMKFNTEHVWPQSLFDKKTPMKSDLHHIFPTDAQTNNRRSNHPFGEVSSVKWERQGSRLGENNYFLPRGESRGIIARAMFYIATRYENYRDFLKGQEGTLREWHFEYLPTEKEKLRNEKVFSFQGNRNPFIDYPQYAYRIPSFRWAEDSSWQESMGDTLVLPSLKTELSQFNFPQPKEIKKIRFKKKGIVLVFDKEEAEEIRVYDNNGRLIYKVTPDKRRARIKGPMAKLFLLRINNNWQTLYLEHRK